MARAGYTILPLAACLALLIAIITKDAGVNAEAPEATIASLHHEAEKRVKAAVNAPYKKKQSANITTRTSDDSYEISAASFTGRYVAMIDSDSELAALLPADSAYVVHPVLSAGKKSESAISYAKRAAAACLIKGDTTRCTLAFKE